VAKEKTLEDLFPVFKLWVEVDSVVEAGFREVSGLRLERKVEEVEEGGVNDRWHFLPGRTRQGNIVLKYGLTTSQTLWDWYQAGINDLKITRHKVTILVRGPDGKVVKAWSAADAFPVKWEGASLNVETNQVAIETLEIAHHGLTVTSYTETDDSSGSSGTTGTTG